MGQLAGANNMLLCLKSGAGWPLVVVVGAFVK